MKKKTLMRLVYSIGIIFFFLISSFYLINLDKFIIITTNSMDPNIKVGDVVYYESLYHKDFDDLDEGEIVVIKGPLYYYEHGVDPSIFRYLNNNTPIIHRMINKYYNESEQQWYFETKGDNNPNSDGCLRGYLESGIGTFIFNSSNPIMIPETEILGKVNTKIPFIGYLGIYFSNIIIIIIFLGIIKILMIIIDIEIDISLKSNRKLKK